MLPLPIGFTVIILFSTLLDLPFRIITIEYIIEYSNFSCTISLIMTKLYNYLYNKYNKLSTFLWGIVGTCFDMVVA